MLAVLVHGHLGALELVELAADGGLVARREARPRLVRAPVVVVRLRTVTNNALVNYLLLHFLLLGITG